jgi:predicted ATPase/class 3 adenylate cyclase/Flp pilus assembly protein TadD
VAERSETLALLFTDIEGSTNLLRSLGAEYRTLLAEHRRLLRDAFAAHGGTVLRGEGDALFVTFDDPSSAILGAIDGQVALAKAEWPAGSHVRVRMGIHVGEVTIDEDDDYVGLAVHQAARISAAAHGGQVLTSKAMQAQAEPRVPPEVSLKSIGRFRLKDFPEPEDLFQLHHPDLPDDFPAPRTAPGTRHNLPKAISSFVGRDRDVAELAELLETARLVTLTGPGGCGKTRLAIEAASASLPVRPDGIWFVDLAPVSDRELVLSVAANAMGVQESRAASADSALIDFLSSGRPLVILDNCEHLIPTCAELAEKWLSACPGLTILVTAREPIGVAGEVIRRVGGLKTPTDTDTGESSEAVQLFIERARSQEPEFEFGETELAEIAHVTNRLDGIPLAIEMAAALVGTLTVGEILSRLDDRFRLLTGGGGRTLGRQQTLLATVDWSHDLLSEPERVLLRRLSVMSGSFSLEDVEAVCVGDGIDRTEVVTLLRKLVATSWVMRERGGDRAAYRLLETSRQYALDKLVSSSEAQRFRSKHSEWFADLAETGAESMLGGPDQTRWFDRIGSELDNFRTALAWSLGDGDPALGLRLGAALSRFWEVRGHWTEGLGWLEEALARAPDAEDALRGRALVAASFLAFYRGRLESARSMVTEGLAAAVRAHDKATEARGLRFEAVIEQRIGDLAAAIDSAKKAVELSRSHGAAADLAFALQVLGRLLADDDRDEARARYEEGLEVARRAEDAVSQIYLLYALGRLHLRAGDNERARELYAEALDLSQQVGERWMAMNVLVGLSYVSEDVDAGPALEEMVGVLRQTGNRMMQIVWLRQLAHRRRMEGDHEGAKRAVDEALEIVKREATPEANVLGQYILGSHLDETEKDYAGALREFRNGLRAAHSQGSEWETTFGLTGVARMLARTGENERAALLLGAAAAMQEKVGMLPQGPRAEAQREATEMLGNALGEDELQRLRAEGRDMSLDEAVALATEAAN